MGAWNLGSVATEVLLLIPSVPSTISGAPLERISDRQRLFMEQYTGLSIGSVGITETYQPALLNLTCAATLESMEIQGAGAASISIGEFSVSKGRGSNYNAVKDSFKEQGMFQLQSFGRKINFYQAL